MVAPHRVWGPETNDLVLQLRKRKIGRIILGGMLANMCVESHLRELIEQGFEVTVAKDATAAPKHPTGATATPRCHQLRVPAPCGAVCHEHRRNEARPAVGTSRPSPQ